MIFDVLIIGVGNLGIRNIQGLLNLEHVVIHALDSDINSIENAKDFIRLESEINHIDTKVFFYDNLSKIDFKIDLIIISTTANGRAELISEVLLNVPAKFMLIEKVVAQTVEELYLINSNLQKSNIQAWINLPRRIMPSWQQLKDDINTNHPISLEVSGGKWGMASNSIHMLNLAEWMSDSKVQKLTSLFTSSDKVYATKRNDYLDVTGEIFCKFQDESSIHIKSNSTTDPVIIKLLNNNNTFIVNEYKGYYSKNYLKKQRFKLDFQSEIIGLIVISIMNNSNCLLPTFESVFPSHVMLIEELSKHPKFINMPKLPIT
jgi:predicted dehydrogenase